MISLEYKRYLLLLPYFSSFFSFFLNKTGFAFFISCSYFSLVLFPFSVGVRNAQLHSDPGLGHDLQPSLEGQNTLSVDNNAWKLFQLCERLGNVAYCTVMIS